MIQERGFDVMELLKVDVITPEIVDFINEKMAEGQGIREILRRELGAKSVTKKVRGEVNKLNEKLQDAGYFLEEGVYKLKQQEVEIIEESNEESQQKSETKNKKTYMTKKQKAELEEQKRKEFEEKLKENPYTLVSNWEVLQTVDRIAISMAEGEVKPLGIYVNSQVEKVFEALQKRFYYIPNYLLISASIDLTYKNLEHLIESNLSQEFIEKAYKVEKNVREFRINETKKDIKFVEKKLEELDNESEEAKLSRERLSDLRKELKEHQKRKQTNVKTSVLIADTTLSLIQDKFPFLSKSDVANLCVYSFSKCFTKELNQLKGDLKNNE